MKKIVIVLIIIFPISLAAQKMKMGILLNPQISWLTPAGSDNLSNKGSKFGFDIGLSVEKYFSDNYAILTGISLNNIGGKISYTDSIEITLNNKDEVNIIEGESEMNFNLQYIKVPIALKFKTKEIGYFTYYAQIGLEGGVNVKANVSIDANDIKNQKVSEEVALFNAGYLIGAGAEYSIGGNTCILLGVQYQNGFIDVMNTTDDKVIAPKVTLILGIMF